MWNRLPLSLREIICPGEFKTALLEHLWKEDITAVYRQCLHENEIDVDSDLENSQD